MGIVTSVQKEYVESVAGEPVTDSDVAEFIDGLENHIRVTFDVTDEDGFLVERQQQFASLKAAMEFVRRLNQRAVLS